MQISLIILNRITWIQEKFKFFEGRKEVVRMQVESLHPLLSHDLPLCICLSPPPHTQQMQLLLFLDEDLPQPAAHAVSTIWVTLPNLTS